MKQQDLYKTFNTSDEEAKLYRLNYIESRISPTPPGYKEVTHRSIVEHFWIKYKTHQHKNLWTSLMNYEKTMEEKLEFNLINTKCLLAFEQEVNSILEKLRINAENDQKWLPKLFIEECRENIGKYEKRLFYLTKRRKQLKDIREGKTTKNPHVYIDLDEVKRGNDIIEFLKAHGHHPSQTSQNGAMFKCIFHRENTGSFYVDKNRNRYHCFGCSVSGSIIDITAHLNNCSIGEAIKLLI